MQKETELMKLADGYLEEAEKLIGEGHMGNGIILYRKAIQVLEQMEKSRELVDALCRLGLLYTRFGEKEMSIDTYMEALDVAMKDSYMYAQARIHNNIGNELMEMQDFLQARDLFLRALEFTKTEDCKKHPNHHRLLLIIYMNLACIHTSLKQLDEAEKFIKLSRQNLAKSNVDKTYSILVYDLLLKAEQGRRDFYNENVDDLMEWMEANPTDQDFQQHTELLCKLFEELGDYERWEWLLNIYENFAETQDQTYFYMTSAKLWTIFYKSTGDHQNAMYMAAEYFRYAEVYQDEQNQKTSKQIGGKLEVQIMKTKRQEAALKNHVDFLTGVGDEKKFYLDYESLTAEVNISHGNIGIGIVDIDDFHKINEKKGYLEGDNVLKTVGSILQDIMMEYGLVYRRGGAKFLVLLADCTEEMIAEISEEIKDKIPQSVCQGFAYMVPRADQGAEEHVAYARRSLTIAKEQGPGNTVIVETSVKDYHAFYEQYRKNLEESALLESSYQNAEDKEQWLMNIMQRRVRNQELLKENQRLIGKYLTPLLNGTEELKEEAAVSLAHEILDMREAGYMEHLVMLEVAKIVEAFLEQCNYPEEHIHMLIVLGEAYGRLNAEEYFDHSYLYYRKLNMYRGMIDQIPKRTLRKTLYDAFLRGGIIFAESSSVTLGQNLDNIQYELEYYEEENIREKLRLTEEESKETIENFVIHSVAGATLQILTPDPGNSELVEAMELIETIYKEQKAKAEKVSDIDDRLFGTYYRMLWLLGRCTLDQCYLKHKEYFESVQGREEDALTTDAAFRTSISFRMTLYYIPEMVNMYNHLTAEAQQREKDYVNSLLEAYMIYLSALPKGGKETGLTDEIYHSIARILQYVPDWMNAFNLIFNVLVERNLDNSIHSKMVSEISKQILNMVYRMQPDLLMGTCDSWDDEEIQANYEKILEFVSNAGLIHDIGKIEINDIINQQVRRLTELERENIKKHPEFGVKLVEKTECMKPYLPLIMGHHRYYNDQAGYPEEYSYQEHDEPLLVNIIQMADSLDAATDDIGRSYTRTKTLEEILDEFETQQGVRYNPILVGLMKKDTEFQREVKELVTKGREEICYEIYRSYTMFRNKE